MFYNQAQDVPVSITEDTIAQVVREALQNLTQKREATANREAADLGEIETELEEVSNQLSPLLKFPSNNRQQIARLKAKSAELWAQRDQAQAQLNAAGTAQVQAQRAQIEAQLQPLQDEYNQKKNQPTLYHDRLKELAGAMKPLYQQLDGLQ